MSKKCRKKFQNMFSQNNDLKKPHIKPNKATKKLKSDQEEQEQEQ